MDSVERAIGRLESSQSATNHRLNAIENKLDSLLRFKWQAIGIGSAIGFIASLVVSIIAR